MNGINYIKTLINITSGKRKGGVNCHALLSDVARKSL